MSEYEGKLYTKQELAQAVIAERERVLKLVEQSGLLHLYHPKVQTKWQQLKQQEGI